jgi:hypothetical protein
MQGTDQRQSGQFDAPEQRFCPAGVYEILGDEDGRPACRSMHRMCPLQDLRHQGSQPEHQLGRAARRRRADLPEYVVSNDDITRFSCRDSGELWLMVYNPRLNPLGEHYMGFLADKKILITGLLSNIPSPTASPRPAIAKAPNWPSPTRTSVSKTASRSLPLNSAATSPFR